MAQQVTEAFETAQIVDTAAPDWYEETPDPRARGAGRAPDRAEQHAPSPKTPIAVLTRHSNLSEARTPSRQELTFNECANDLFAMIATRRLPRPVGARRARVAARRAHPTV